MPNPDPAKPTKLGLVGCNIAWKWNEIKMKKFKKDASFLTSANLHHFLDEINYGHTQTDRAYPDTQYCDWTHLKPLAELPLKFPNPDPA